MLRAGARYAIFGRGCSLALTMRSPTQLIKPAADHTEAKKGKLQLKELMRTKGKADSQPSDPRFIAI